MIQAFLLLSLFVQDDAPAREAFEKFRSAYAKPDAAARAAAVTELAATRHELVLKKLAALLLVDEKEVRVAAAQGLGGFGEHKKHAAAALTRAIGPNGRMPEVQAAILEALGTLKHEESLPVVHQCLRKRDPKVSGAAVTAVGEIQSRHSFEPLIELLKDLEKIIGTGGGGGGAGLGGLLSVPGGGDEAKNAKALRDQVIKVFQQWTGEKWPTAGEWQVWWERHKSRCREKRRR